MNVTAPETSVSEPSPPAPEKRHRLWLIPAAVVAVVGLGVVALAQRTISSNIGAAAAVLTIAKASDPTAYAEACQAVNEAHSMDRDKDLVLAAINPAFETAAADGSSFPRRYVTVEEVLAEFWDVCSE